ncbi:hypothetical protein [Streptomyces sp. NPDC051546]|uniref:hypothetical protein n=1 Tax=Streptomyces sp. NPDC051546 TaxID=3365655 RepID=UPI00379A6407
MLDSGHWQAEPLRGHIPTPRAPEQVDYLNAVINGINGSHGRSLVSWSLITRKRMAPG